jgi:catalase (peroxidase I)
MPFCNLRTSQARLSSWTTSRMPILRTSAVVTPNNKQAMSLAECIVHGGLASVVKIACAAGTHLV